MFKKIFLITLLIGFIQFVDAQTAIIQTNSNSFCGINSILEIDDVSTGTINTTWEITGPIGFIPVNSTNTSETVVLTHIGNYNIKLTACNAIPNCDIENRAIVLLQKPNAVINTTDSVVYSCAGKAINLNAFSSTFPSATSQTFWDSNYPSGTDFTNQAITFLVNIDSKVSLIIRDANGCSDTAFQQISVIQNPVASFDLGPQCIGFPFDLVSTSNSFGANIDSLHWFIDNTTYLFTNPTTYTHSVKDTIPIYLYIENEFGCSGLILRNVTIGSKPFVNFNFGDTTICEGEEIEISATGADSYVWSNGENTNSITVAPNSLTKYSAVGHNNGSSCESGSNEIEIAVVNKPKLNFEAQTFNPSIGAPVSIEVSYQPQFSLKDELFWLEHNTSNELKYDKGLENSFVANEAVSFPIQLKYFRDNFECSLDSTIDFTIIEDCSANNILIPNIFTPNKDGQHDVFLINGFTIETILEFIVFDRSGKEMYNNIDIKIKNGRSITGWDGTDINGQICNSGVYVYQYRVKCLNGAEFQAAGNITLMR